MENIITLDKNLFDPIKLALGDLIKDKCDFCKVNITKDNFGYLSKDMTCCKGILCLVSLEFPEEEDKKLN